MLYEISRASALRKINYKLISFGERRRAVFLCSYTHYDNDCRYRLTGTKRNVIRKHIKHIHPIDVGVGVGVIVVGIHHRLLRLLRLAHTHFRRFISSKKRPDRRARIQFYNPDHILSYCLRIYVSGWTFEKKPH